MSTHSVEQAMENLNVIKTALAKNLPGGEKNIKSMFLKSTNSLALPIYEDKNGNPNQVELPNNMSQIKIKRAKKLTKIKRLNNGKTKKST